METPYYAPPLGDASRPSIGFPLGTALLLIIIFSLSGVFSCCYHWDKFRSFRRSFDPEADIDDGSPSKPMPIHTSTEECESQSLPVLMPGDQTPTFIALPCPREPPRPEKITVVVQKPLPSKPPPRMALPDDHFSV